MRGKMTGVRREMKKQPRAAGIAGQQGAHSQKAGERVEEGARRAAEMANVLSHVKPRQVPLQFEIVAKHQRPSPYVSKQHSEPPASRDGPMMIDSKQLRASSTRLVPAASNLVCFRPLPLSFFSSPLQNTAQIPHTKQ